MLRRFTRWAFGLSAAYHGVMGAFALLAPALAIVYNGGGAADAGDPYLRALYRGMGAFMVFASLVHGLVAKDPDGSPILVLFGGVLAAPLGAYIAKKVPAKGLLVLVGCLLALTSLYGVYKALSA